VAWGQTVILQELITQLIQSGALPVERAQRVFDFALQRTMKATAQAPGATRFVMPLVPATAVVLDDNGA
jgi:hypothetical protein